MAKIMSVAEALETMKPKVNDKGVTVPNRFSKKSFETLTLALANDTEFIHKHAIVKGDELVEVEDILVTKEFRKFLKKIVEQCGVDKSESERLMMPEFQINDVSGLYEFMSAAIYKYLESGNTFDFITTPDCKASLTMAEVDEQITIGDAYNPRDRSEYLGKFETTKKKHKEIKAKSSCPKFLKHRKRIDQ